jgi:hypothetical protein
MVILLGVVLFSILINVILRLNLLNNFWFALLSAILLNVVAALKHAVTVGSI